MPLGSKCNIRWCQLTFDVIQWGFGAGLQVCYVAQRIGQEGLGGGRGEYRMQVLHKLEARGEEGCQ